ncbi:MAG: caspase family protein [Rhizobiaceae bacterium]|nr:caspase family protein [Rhizobiaceae bacterium]
MSAVESGFGMMPLRAFGAACLALVLFSQGAIAQQPKSLALVIGNGAYAALEPDRQAVADADLVAKSLKSIGFEVDAVDDVSKKDFEAAIAATKAKAGQDGILFVYYSGRALQFGEKNYLAPVDLKLAQASDLPGQGVALDDLLQQLGGRASASTIVVVDAADKNPFDQSAMADADAIGDGLARVTNLPAGTLIAFSAAPGSVASRKANYASSLATILKSQGKGLDSLLKMLRARVVVSSGGTQIPWDATALLQSVVLYPEADKPVAIAPDACDLAAGHPSDPDRVGPSVEYANLDPQLAIPACERAVAANPDNMRFKSLLARALDKAGRGEEAAVLNEAAMKAGYIAAFHNMGNLYRKGLGVPEDIGKAFELYLYAAEKGHPEDQSNVGYMYMRGEGVAKDYEKARFWLEKAAAQNWATAYDKLGLLYLNGWGVKKDPERAFEEFGKGANLGNAPALVNYANAFKAGIGTPKNPKRAFQYYTQAAHLGSQAAYINLGQLSMAGEGTQKNLTEAAFWFTLSSREGNEEAQKRLTEVTGMLSEAEKEELRERLEQWSSRRFG